MIIPAEAITEDMVEILHVQVMIFNGVQLSEVKALTILLILEAVATDYVYSNCD
jgi:hypothetical protein